MTSNFTAAELRELADKLGARSCLDKAAALREYADLKEAAEKVVTVHGTFNCPICGYDKPHGHSDEVVNAYRDDQIRNDGWVSTIVRMPKEVGFYLGRGHDFEVPKPDYNNINYLAYQRGKWGMIQPDAEVLRFGGIMRGFSLHHLAGQARIDGSEGRTEVRVTPTHWRKIPAFAVAPLLALKGDKP